MKDLRHDGTKVCGLCHTDEQLIEINANQVGEKFIHTLLHEIGHAVFNEAAINETEINDDLQEVIVEQFAKVLTKAFSLKQKET